MNVSSTSTTTTTTTTSTTTTTPTQTTNLQASNSTKYRDLSMKKAIGQQKDLMNQITNEMEKLQNNIQNNPNQVNISGIRNLQKDLIEINFEIEQKKLQNIQHDKKSRIKIPLVAKEASNVTILTGVVGFIAIVIGGGIAAASTAVSAQQYQDINYTNTGLALGLNIAQVLFQVLCAGIVYQVCSTLQNIENDKFQYRSLAKISHIQKREEEQFDKFLEGIEELRSKQNKNNEEMQKQFKDLVRRLDSITSSGSQTTGPTKDEWLSFMLQDLPEEHPFMRRMSQLYESAIEIAKLEKNASNKAIESNSTNSSPNIVRRQSKKVITAANLNKVKNSNDSSDPDTSFNTPVFTGEKLSLHEAINIRITTTIQKDPSATENLHHYKRIYQQQWEQLEQDIGSALGPTRVFNNYISKDGLKGDLPTIDEQNEQIIIEQNEKNNISI